MATISEARDAFRVGTHELQSRLIVGTGKYATFDAMRDSLEASGADCVTVAVRRERLYDGDGRNILDFLDPRRQQKQGLDRDREAETNYLEIVRKLVCFFAGRGCGDAEDLAMESVLRVAAKCGEVDVSGFRDRTGYFYGVAKNVLHEWRHDSLRESTKRQALRMELRRLPASDPQSWSKKEAVHRRNRSSD